ncbi:MAG TPA: amino acid adenylation domain-containing protein [Chloroflexia bacterium]|nr:amino acid adenylation domain-containing protein [Chloroflexia bacterium]
MMLQDLARLSAERNPQALAVKGAQSSLTYGELDQLANRLARALSHMGIGPGDRVGLWLDKTPQSVAVMQAVLRLGGAYVPLDPLSPAARVRTILEDCAVRALVTTERRAETVLTDELAGVSCLCLDGSWQGYGMADVLLLSDEPLPEPPVGENDIAYILYTSGSTGKPKGVCISHRNALAFIEWAAEELKATSQDRFSNHAPFHFDLSVLDLYVAFLAGASVHLIADGLSYVPKRLVDFMLQERITVWYSVPSVLVLMMDQGGMLDLPELPLRAILFAGEPFPIRHLRRLYERWPEPRYLNLYGPTETNVCTYFEVTEIEPDRVKPVPIGRACSGDSVWAMKPDGTVAGPGEEGELMVSGPTVMLGYWGREPHGDKPYPTGDLVRLQEDGSYVYLGRRDHMVKVRGHRVELGDIEAALEKHPAIHEAAVVVIGVEMQARLVAYLVSANGHLPALLEIKKHCAENLPRYMIVDEVRALANLPRTRNGKIDRLTLLQQESIKSN